MSYSTENQWRFTKLGRSQANVQVTNGKLPKQISITFEWMQRKKFQYVLKFSYVDKFIWNWF